MNVEKMKMVLPIAYYCHNIGNIEKSYGEYEISFFSFNSMEKIHY